MKHELAREYLGESLLNEAKSGDLTLYAAIDNQTDEAIMYFYSDKDEQEVIHSTDVTDLLNKAIKGGQVGYSVGDVYIESVPLTPEQIKKKLVVEKKMIDAMIKQLSDKTPIK